MFHFPQGMILRMRKRLHFERRRSFAESFRRLSPVRVLAISARQGHSKLEDLPKILVSTSYFGEVVLKFICWFHVLYIALVLLQI